MNKVKTCQRLYKCPRCSMIYWGYELFPQAQTFPPSLGVNCPNCGASGLYGQATPGEAGFIHGLIAFAVAFAVLYWALNWHPVFAAGTALTAGILTTVLSGRWHRPDSPDEDQRFAANELMQHGEALQRAGNLSAARSAYERAAAILCEDVDLKLEGAIIGRLANVERKLGDFTSALSHYTDALGIAEQIDNVSDIINRQNNVATLLGDDLHNPTEAIHHLEHAVALTRDLDDPKRLCGILCHLVKREREAGYYDQAQAHISEALTVAKYMHDSETLSHVLYERACIAIAENRNSDAAADLQEALNVLGPLGNPDTRQHLAGTLDTVRSAIREGATITILPPGKVSPPEKDQKWLPDIGPEASEALRLAMDHMVGGRLELAAAEFEKALQQDCIRKNLKASSLAASNLGDILRTLGEVGRAIEILKDALEFARQAKDSYLECSALLNLGITLHVKGAWTESRNCLSRALDLAKEMSDCSAQGRVLSSLGSVYRDSSEYKRAEILYKQAYGLAQAADDPELQGAICQNWGNLYFKQHLWQEAKQYYEKALEFAQQTRDASLQGTALHMLGNIYQRLGRLEPALEALQQSISIAGPCPSETGLAARLNSLAIVEQNLGRLEEAREHYHQAVKIYRKLGIAHPEIAGCLENLGVLLVRSGEVSDGRDYILQASTMDNIMVAQAFAIASEDARFEFLAQAENRLSDLVSLVARGGPLEGDLPTMQACADIVIRRKGVTFEALAAQRDFAASSRHPELIHTLKELDEIRWKLAQLILAGQGVRWDGSLTPKAADLTEKKHNLEQQVTEYFPHRVLNEQLHRACCSAIAQNLPDESALIEFLHFKYFDFPSFDREAYWIAYRYAAFILPAGKSDNIQMIDLGDAEPIDQMIARFRSLITGETEGQDIKHMGTLSSEEVWTLRTNEGTNLRAVIFDPLMTALGNRKRLLIAPDSNLNRLPLEVLPTTAGRYLIDDYHISYVAAGRDVLRFGVESSIQPTQPVVIADPDFDLCCDEPIASIETAQQPRRHSTDSCLANLHFSRLHGTRFEGECIAEMLSVQPWLGKSALEARLKARRSPRIMHLATHGFFLEDQKRDISREHRNLGPVELQIGSNTRLPSRPAFENPLLRSGLALAGVNTWLKKGNLPAEAEDGILTAEDVLGINMLATDLVVLSACDTGLGELRTGEGVFGLRRTFALAGAKTLIMSLWKVPDLVTAILMKRFYENLLLRGMACDRSLREAQLYIRDVTIDEIRSLWLSSETIERLAAGNPFTKFQLRRFAQLPDNFCPFRDLFFWGAFICQGKSEAMT